MKKMMITLGVALCMLGFANISSAQTNDYTNEDEAGEAYTAPGGDQYNNPYVLTGSSSTVFMYPNPVTTQTKLVLDEPSTFAVNVDIIDLNGTLVRSLSYSPGTYSIDVDMSALGTGLYTVRVREKGKPMQYIKAVKQMP